MARGTNAVVDLGALQHNFRVIRQRVGSSRVMAVVKADAYGHGIERVAAALPDADGFGVAIIEEAIQLRDAGVTQPIVLLEGVTSPGDLAEAASRHLDVVVHTEEQLLFLESTELPAPLRVWLKFNTGMHRLGVEIEKLAPCYRALRSMDKVSDIVLTSHFACADEPDPGHALAQQARFEGAVTALNDSIPETDVCSQSLSLANSAGVFSRPESHYDWVRPGIALYGASPLLEVSAAQLDLKPVMELRSTVLATRQVKPGETVGYGATWEADQETPVAIVGIGYGDGYPRHVPSGTPVLIRGVRCPMVGRVSMDMLAVDLRPVLRAENSDHREPVTPGEPVTLWGNGLPIEDIARAAGTINYELLCQVTGRVKRVYR
ncbi:MAG: alanine racemase [Ketobacteraceae bacterium]|nr:alanine racemase [Ketobacteraceae bacterium]